MVAGDDGNCSGLAMQRTARSKTWRASRIGADARGPDMARRERRHFFA